jgi:hypothetical protein
LHKPFSNFNSEPKEKEKFVSSNYEELKINDVDDLTFKNLNFKNLEKKMPAREKIKYLDK